MRYAIISLCLQPSRLTIVMSRFYLTVGRLIFGVNMPRANISRNCKACGKHFEKYLEPSKIKKGLGVYCSSDCSKRVGYPHSDETKRRLSQSKMGSKNPQYGRTDEKSMHWKGDQVGYFGVHDWMTKHFGQPKFCERCGDTNENTRYEWANISGEYMRSRDDFFRLCKKCHNNLDGVNAWQNFKKAKACA